MRRDFVECAAGQVRLRLVPGSSGSRRLYRLNEARLAHYDPVIKRQTPAFDAAQGALKEALDGLFAEAARELVGLPDQATPGQGAALAAEPSRRAERVRRPPAGASG